jgi:hypothetical protein
LRERRTDAANLLLIKNRKKFWWGSIRFHLLTKNKNIFFWKNLFLKMRWIKGVWVLLNNINRLLLLFI